MQTDFHRLILTQLKEISVSSSSILLLSTYIWGAAFVKANTLAWHGLAQENWRAKIRSPIWSQRVARPFGPRLPVALPGSPRILVRRPSGARVRSPGVPCLIVRVERVAERPWDRRAGRQGELKQGQAGISSFHFQHIKTKSI